MRTVSKLPMRKMKVKNNTKSIKVTNNTKNTTIITVDKVKYILSYSSDSYTIIRIDSNTNDVTGKTVTGFKGANLFLTVIENNVAIIARDWKEVTVIIPINNYTLESKPHYPLSDVPYSKDLNSFMNK